MLKSYYLACLDQCNRSVVLLYFVLRREHCTELGEKDGALDDGFGSIAICGRREQISQPTARLQMNTFMIPAFTLGVRRNVTAF